MSQYLTGLNLLDPGVKRYNGGTSSFTMDANGTTNGTLLWVSGVAQIPGTDYNVSGATITTTTAAPAGTNTVVSLQLFETGIVNTVADNGVTTAKINDDAVTLAKMASGTDGNIISYDASGNPVAIATGNDGQVLTSAGAGAPPAFEAAGGWTLGTPVATTSGTSVTFGSLPSTIKIAILLMDEVSTNSGSDDFDITIGDSGGLHTASYVSASKPSSMITSTAAFNVYATNAGFNYTGAVTIMLQNSSTFRYVSTHVVSRGGNDMLKGTGVVTLDTVMTQISIDGSAGGTFDNGAVNLLYM